MAALRAAILFGVYSYLTQELQELNGGAERRHSILGFYVLSTLGDSYIE
jgi:hypothetical protein